MLFAYLIRNPWYSVVPLLIQIVSYVKILKKMGKKPLLGIVPFAGEWAMSHDLLKKMRHFWRPFVFSAVLILTARWLRGGEIALVLRLSAFVVYGLFLAVLYARLAKQFGKKAPFAAGLIFLPLIFLPVLAFGKSAYLGRREFKPGRERSTASKVLGNIALVLVSGAELTALLVVCFALTVLVRPARPIAQYMLNDDINKYKSVTASDEFVSRKDTLGPDFAKTVDAQRSRSYFYPDHSGDKKTVVMEYIIGSNLEDARGSASINIAQMLDATSRGDGVDFVIQAGGSERWFTKGIKDMSVGRYLISGGEIETAEMMDNSTCMSEPDKLSDFIIWAKEKYPADRYMLVLWDHGGGFASGYGVDDLNPRDDASTMSSSEIIKAVGTASKKTGIKFDMIGFDACLMQDVEMAKAFEPYADYYLASQETEPAYGWFYTDGFGRLAEDPTLSTETFGEMMVSSYDQLYRKQNNGEAQPDYTLSLIDLTLIDGVHDRLEELYAESTTGIRNKPEVFADLSAARNGAYEFQDMQQVDLINYLTRLKKADYKQQVARDSEIDEFIDAVNACVVCRNADSAEGINGISVDFPYAYLSEYSGDRDQLKKAGYTTQRVFFDNFLSVIASMNKPDIKSLSDVWKTIKSGKNLSDYTGESWYIKAYDDYDTADMFIDIPVEEQDGAYLPQLPEKTWDTILDTRVMAYMAADDGDMYLGQEHFAKKSADGRPLVYMNGRWVTIGGKLVCYENTSAQETEEGLVYKGKVRARLNGLENITLHIEWDPVKPGEEDDGGLTGHVSGYEKDSEELEFFMKKGLEHLNTGDTIEFIFDYYDEEGERVKTAPYGGTVRIVSENTLSVKDQEFEPGTELKCYGILTDIYQRELMTEVINKTIE